MCHQNSQAHLSAEDAHAAEGLLIYCKPIEFYNLLEEHTVQNPFFLQRCLQYKIKAKHNMRMGTGNVVFNYKYHNNTLQKTEVTKDFSCPFCSVKCASFEGHRNHLSTSHDLFKFEFWVTEEYQAVDVSVNNDIWRSRIVTDGVDPILQTFFLCPKPRKRTTSKNSSQNAKLVHTCDQKLGSSEVVRNGFLNYFLDKKAGTNSLPMPITTAPMDVKPLNQLPLEIYDNDTHSDKTSKAFLNENDMWNGNTAETNGATNASVAECLEHVASRLNVSGVSTATAQSFADLESLPLVKSRKLSVKRPHSKNRIHQKGQFLHSHKGQGAGRWSYSMGM